MAHKKQKLDNAFLSKGLISYIDPESASSEQYRSIRTNIELLPMDEPLRLIMVTSPGYKEGKTLTAMNLAVSMAQQGKRILIIDAHVKKADLSAMFNLSEHVGLTNVLTGRAELLDTVHATDIGKLDVLASGTSMDHISELLQPRSMKEILDSGKEHYDMMIIDAPPVLHASEVKLLAHYCDGVIMVVRNNRTKNAAAAAAKETLAFSGAKMMGIIMNQF
ncbi:CpsD/CapB family tyrosine-protein kinase [Paenibacillus spongiae]|uniref:non-specific protein-tyrosine kinase n=1 Tax=Paenibacillus spongiae TaxID=2909671 RepID=A0ABY5SCL9_9BACL|nr:CpsD/CapB family tyrosine-protein kinase [Paenibacillus spongiae]UVI31519.1 CpsD/CapB family tyrosine-protein kinase [Paenibacillus spongiae]